MNLYINENSLLINKNIGLDTFYMSMMSYFPNLGVSVQGNIENFQRIVSRYVASEIINYTKVIISYISFKI